MPTEGVGVGGSTWRRWVVVLKFVQRFYFFAFLFCGALVIFPLAFISCGGKNRLPPSLPTSGSTLPSTAPSSKAPELPELPRVRILLKEGFQLVKVEGSNLAPQVIVKVESQNISLTTRKQEVLRVGSGFKLQPEQGKFLSLDGNSYRGDLLIFMNPLKKPVVVNEIDIEDYLRGVVANELNPVSFPQPEAIKAQSVAARTFAVASLGQYASRGFDLYADQRSQTYKGRDSEFDLSNQAIRKTRGILATHKNKPIVAMYSSTCGGITENFQSFFRGSKVPYLMGEVNCPDNASPHYNWESSISVSDLKKNLHGLISVGLLQKLVILERSKTGRTTKLKFVGRKGEKILEKSTIRRVLKLSSNWITSLDPLYDRSGHIVEILTKGRGWGHGVGLCQWGSIELARRGWSYQKILKHYYPGIALKKFW